MPYDSVIEPLLFSFYTHSIGGLGAPHESGVQLTNCQRVVLPFFSVELFLGINFPATDYISKFFSEMIMITSLFLDNGM